MLLDCFGILSISELIDGILIEDSLTVVLANELIRNLALTEAGNLETVLVLLVRSLKSLVEFLFACFEADDYLRMFFLLN